MYNNIVQQANIHKGVGRLEKGGDSDHCIPNAAREGRVERRGCVVSISKSGREGAR